MKCLNILETRIEVLFRENLSNVLKIYQFKLPHPFYFNIHLGTPEEADVNIEPDNQQPHKNNQPDQFDIESDNNNDKTPKTVNCIT